ncbi:potassium channel family protein [Domibacillus robiginosus]|uniref:potassium channel family protein n=1 Tax=Domibacillus robiginosus TaxID=1071054 RepID=UPI00067C780A|nr:potassium channel family protein [Domibacillus robiginosus]
MNEVYVIVGIILLIIGLIDFIWTTLWIEGGAGPVTRHLSTGIWKIMRKVSGDRGYILSLAGPLLLMSAVLMWVCLFWGGWTLFFAGDPNALTNTQVKASASWIDRLYFSGYIFFTLGNGSITPNGVFWKFATVCATASGMLSITLAVTYLISVLSAASQKRSFAQSVMGIGSTGEEIVQVAWSGKDFHNIDILLNTLASDLSKLTAQNNAYPILHYYHSVQPKKSEVLAVAVLDDALTLLQFGILEKYGPNRLLVKEVRSSIQNYIDTVQTAHIHPAKQTPPVPNLRRLRQKGLPVCSDQEFQKTLHSLEERRKALLGIVEASAQKWPLHN